MKDEVEQELRVLVGLPLWAMGRAVDLEWFQFGNQNEVTDKRGRAKTVGDWALHVQCSWRVTRRENIVVAKRDVYWPAGIRSSDEVEQGWSWDQGGPTRLDERTAIFHQVLDVSPPVVESVKADEVGGVRLVLSGEYALEIFPDHTLDDEYWRLFEPQQNRQHFVIRGVDLKAE
jgi:hypothetical protein